VGQTPGYIWRIQSGQPELWVEIGEALFMNGCTPHPDGRTLLVCERVTGRILAIDQHVRSFGFKVFSGSLDPHCDGKSITPQGCKFSFQFPSSRTG
jgi:hypothetical protein